MMQDLEQFSSAGFDRGASRGKEFLWRNIQQLIFSYEGACWGPLKRALLRSFGAAVGEAVVIKPQVRVTFPWRLSLGAHAWLGERVWLLNLDRITIGSHVCISQGAMLCTGNHDYGCRSFDLMTAPIIIESGAWLCARVFIAPGVTVGHDSVVTAGSVVTADLPAGMICSGNPCAPIKERVTRDAR